MDNDAASPEQTTADRLLKLPPKTKWEEYDA
jgi:hypothetical protein